MIQNVSSATPLDALDYHLREDGLADIRIRRNIVRAASRSRCTIRRRGIELRGESISYRHCEE